MNIFSTNLHIKRTMKIIFTLGLVSSLSRAVPLNDWNDFKTLHSKIYRGDEDIYRMKVYLENLEKIVAHNAKYEQNLVGYKMGVNQFADMLAEEVAAQVNGFRISKDQPRNECDLPKDEAPTSVDWRTKGAVTPVKNQGQCGSCWAFSATGSLEGQNYLRNKELVSLSEQNLVDCSGNYGNEGCAGGLMDQAYQYIKANGGLDTEQSYPYTGEDGACEFRKNDVGAVDTGFCDIPQGDENALLQAVHAVGPISVAIDASQDSFQLYSGGVYDEPNCSSTQLDHGVLVVGYGTENGKDFWLVKNSWGEDWGESGYIKMSRNANNQCGIATQASFPLV